MNQTDSFMLNVTYKWIAENVGDVEATLFLGAHSSVRSMSNDAVRYVIYRPDFGFGLTDAPRADLDDAALPLPKYLVNLYDPRVLTAFAPVLTSAELCLLVSLMVEEKLLAVG